MLEPSALRKLVANLHRHNEWRKEAATCRDYYEGEPFSKEQEQRIRDSGQAPIKRNFIGPIVDVLRGVQTKHKADFVVRGVMDERDVNLAHLLTGQLQKYERLTEADVAFAEASADALISGIGWVEVTQSANPLHSPFDVARVPPWEIWWDLEARRSDLSDARWLIRKCRKDRDQLLAAFPEHGELIRQVASGWSTFALLDGASNPGPTMIMEDGWPEEDWRDTEREQITLYECWYREWVRKTIMRFHDGSDLIMEFNQDDPYHLSQLMTGVAKLETVPLPVTRLSWWLGPHRLADVPCPFRHGTFPYVPIWSFRRHKTGAPYGLVTRMIDAQDEANARLRLLYKALDGRIVTIDADALSRSHNSLAEAREELASPTPMLVTDPHRKNPNGVNINSSQGLPGFQFEAVREAFQAMQDVAGVNMQMLGKAGAATSGVAISSLVEQAATVVAPLFDHQLTARKRVGELMLSMIRESMGGKEQVRPFTRPDNTRGEILLNVPTMDPATGRQYITNDIMQTRMHVDVGDIPAQPSYRAQLQHDLVEVVRSMPPEMQAAVLDLVVKGSDLPNRHELVARIQKIQASMFQAMPAQQNQETGIG